MLLSPLTKIVPLLFIALMGACNGVLAQSKKKQILTLEVVFDSVFMAVEFDRIRQQKEILELTEFGNTLGNKIAAQTKESEKLDGVIRSKNQEIANKRVEIAAQEKALAECKSANRLMADEVEKLKNTPPSVMPEFEKERLCLVQKKWVYPDDYDKTNELQFNYDGSFSSWGQIYDVRAEGTWRFLNNRDIEISIDWNSMGIESFNYTVSMTGCKNILNGSTLYKRSSN
jgi:hypothetical protein